MQNFWIKVAVVVLSAGIVSGAAAVVTHESRLTGVEHDIQYIRESQARIEIKLDNILGD